MILHVCNIKNTIGPSIFPQKLAKFYLLELDQPENDPSFSIGRAPKGNESYNHPKLQVHFLIAGRVCIYIYIYINNISRISPNPATLTSEGLVLQTASSCPSQTKMLRVDVEDLFQSCIGSTPRAPGWQSPPASLHF